MNKKNICILYGGKSGEHEVSTRSAASIVKNLNRDRYNILLIGIDRDGIWHYQEKPEIVNIQNQGDALKINLSDKPTSIVPERGIQYGDKILQIDVVFPALHGTFGEDGTIQGLLEIADLPYVGSGVLGSALSMDKEKAKRIWRETGLPIVDFEVIAESEIDIRVPITDISSEKIFSKIRKHPAISRAIKRFDFPMFVKPGSAGSSVGVTKVYTEEELVKAIKEAFQFDSKVLIERSIEAREVECSVIGNTNPRAFLPGEIIPTHDFYDYEAKYIDPNGATLVIPAKLPGETQKEIMETAIKAYRAVEAWGFARVDFLLDKKTGKLYINEINTIPGFTIISMFPKLCENGGLPYSEIIDTLVKLALEKYREKKSKRYRL